MNAVSPLILIGIGGGGCAVATGVSRAFGENMRYVRVDTDARTGEGSDPFVLLGGNRLSGRGSGGDVVSARLAAEDSISAIDESISDVRLAVIVTCLGGGTGGGATLELLKYLDGRGIPAILFATTPFTFEGADRQRNARGILPMLEEAACTSFVLPLDKLVGGVDNMESAMRRAVDTLAVSVTLLWRLVEKPGYLRLDVERLRHLAFKAGRGRFATVTAQGEDRAPKIVETLAKTEMLSASSGPVRAILCGLLAGEDLRLSEVARIANGVQTAFGGDKSAFELATVNDEATFSGRLSAVVMLFETKANVGDGGQDQTAAGGGHRRHGVLGLSPSGRGRFNNAEPTSWHGEDLDVPTFLRQNISLDM